MRTQMNSLLLALLACSGLGSALQAETIEVDVQMLTFEPETVVARPGDVIRWTWVTGGHTVTSGSECTADGLFDSPLNEDTPVFEWEVPSDASGTIPYFCVPHCDMGMQGSILIESGAMIRYVGIEASSVEFGDPAATSRMAIAFGGGHADRFAMGFEVEEGASLLTIAISGSGSVIHRNLLTGVSEAYSAGIDHEIVMEAGAHGLLASGDVDAIELDWQDPAGSGSGSSDDGDLMVGSISGENGVSIWSTTSRDAETLWIGATNDPASRVTLGLDVTGAAVERSLMWVGAVSGTGFTMPDEARDEPATVFPVGTSTIVVENAGFFAIVLNDDDDDDDDGGGSSCVADLDGNGSVDGADLSTLLGSWGVCP
jgi:plastocyanin